MLHTFWANLELRVSTLKCRCPPHSTIIVTFSINTWYICSSFSVLIYCKKLWEGPMPDVHTHMADTTTGKNTDMHLRMNEAEKWTNSYFITGSYLRCQVTFSYSTVEIRSFGLVENGEGVCYHKHCAIWQFDILWPQRVELYVFCTSCNTEWTLLFHCQTPLQTELPLTWGMQ